MKDSSASSQIVSSSSVERGSDFEGSSMEFVLTSSAPGLVSLMSSLTLVVSSAFMDEVDDGGGVVIRSFCSELKRGTSSKPTVVDGDRKSELRD